jgi:hypothetical protein
LVAATGKTTRFPNDFAARTKELPAVIGAVQSIEPGISRFSDVQLHIGVRVFDAPRNDGMRVDRCQEALTCL